MLFKRSWAWPNRQWPFYVFFFIFKSVFLAASVSALWQVQTVRQSLKLSYSLKNPQRGVLLQTTAYLCWKSSPEVIVAILRLRTIPWLLPGNRLSISTIPLKSLQLFYVSSYMLPFQVPGQFKRNLSSAQRFLRLIKRLVLVKNKYSTSDKHYSENVSWSSAALNGTATHRRQFHYTTHTKTLFSRARHTK